MCGPSGSERNPKGLGQRLHEGWGGVGQTKDKHQCLWHAEQSQREPAWGVPRGAMVNMRGGRYHRSPCGRPDSLTLLALNHRFPTLHFLVIAPRPFPRASIPLAHLKAEEDFGSGTLSALVS